MKRFRRRSWRVTCPDGHIRAFPAVSLEAACQVAFQKSVNGCRRFPDDPRRWWKRKCPGGKHVAERRPAR